MNTTKNPVAKFAGRVNKSAVFRDRTKYVRREKHGRGRNGRG